MTSIPLSLLDELYLHLDRETEPWTVHYEVRVSERFDPERLTDSIRAAARRHPLARARLASWRFQDHGYNWEIGDELEAVPLRVADCPDEAALADERERLFRMSPSLDAAPPFIVLLARGPDGDSVLLNLHHAAGDGVSAARLMLSILRAYAGDEDPLPPVDPLAVHDVRRFTAADSPAKRRARRRAMMQGAWRPFVRAERVAPDGADDRPAYGFELRTLSRDETRTLLARRPDGTTLNDVLLAALAFAIADWNAQHGRPGRLVALTMPVNLRPAEWRHEIFSNFASWVTVWIRPAPGENLGRLAKRVAARTRAIKRDGLGGLAVDLLATPGRATIAAKRRIQYLIPLTGDVVVDTASLSNLGTLEGLPSPFDSATTGAWFSPPGRMPLGVSIGVTTVGDRLHLTLRYRHAQFDRAAARRFVELYRDALLDSEVEELPLSGVLDAAVEPKAGG